MGYYCKLSVENFNFELNSFKVVSYLRCKELSQGFILGIDTYN